MIDIEHNPKFFFKWVGWKKMKGMCQNIKGNASLSSYFPVILKLFAINMFSFYNQNISLIFSNNIIEGTWVKEISKLALIEHDFIWFAFFLVNFCIFIPYF